MPQFIKASPEMLAVIKAQSTTVDVSDYVAALEDYAIGETLVAKLDNGESKRQATYRLKLAARQLGMTLKHNRSSKDAGYVSVTVVSKS